MGQLWGQNDLKQQDLYHYHHFTQGGGGGGAIFPSSDDLQIFFGTLYHEIMRTSPEHKGTDHFLPGTPVLINNCFDGSM